MDIFLPFSSFLFLETQTGPDTAQIRENATCAYSEEWDTTQIPYGMPALGHRIIGLSALLAQQHADSATHVPQGTPSPQTESSSGTGTSGPASTAAQARAAE